MRILTGERLSNGDKPFVIICAIGAGSNVIGEFVILFECSGQIRVEAIQSTIFSSEDIVFDQLKVAVLNQLESFWLNSSPSNSELDSHQKSCVFLVEKCNAYLSFVELCVMTNGRERLEFILENTKSDQLKNLIGCAIQNVNNN
ncbi:MAG: hypothetical protein AAGA30_19150 [Planctomycetota bacterium]